MAEYNLEQQLQRLSALLEASGCKEQTQVMALVQEMLTHADLVGFYQELFEGALQEHEAQRTAAMLQIDPAYTGRILYLQLHESAQHEAVMELLGSVLESKAGQNHCIPMEKGVFAIVYEVGKEDDTKEFAIAMLQSVQEELTCEAVVGMGGIFHSLKEMKDSYQQARTALQAGKQLLDNHVFYAYEDLGLAKAVWEMTPSQCRQFLSEALTPDAERELQNKEMLESIEVFFKYNLNISVAARELYVHRNTLVYRIEKFNKVSGYNLSDFLDAALVQFVLMVRRRMAND